MKSARTEACAWFSLALTQLEQSHAEIGRDFDRIAHVLRAEVKRLGNARVAYSERILSVNDRVAAIVANINNGVSTLQGAGFEVDLPKWSRVIETIHAATKGPRDREVLARLPRTKGVL